MTLIRRHDDLRGAAGGDLVALRLPPFDQPAQALLERDLGSEAEVAPCRGCVGEAAHDAVDGAFGAVLDRKVGVHHLQQRLGEVAQARLDLAGDVVDALGDIAAGGENVGARDVLGVDEVHRLAAVAEDQRRLAVGDALHPAHQHLGVQAVHVHARPVDVEVPQRHVVQAVHRVEAAQHALVEALRGAVESVVVVMVVALVGRELLGHAVDRRRRRGDRPCPRWCRRPPRAR